MTDVNRVISEKCEIFINSPLFKGIRRKGYSQKDHSLAGYETMSTDELGA